MPDEYRPQSYRMGFLVSREAAPIVTKPNWFERVFLRRKPKILDVDGVAESLAEAARNQEEKLCRELFGGA